MKLVKTAVAILVFSSFAANAIVEHTSTSSVSTIGANGVATTVTHTITDTTFNNKTWHKETQTVDKKAPEGVKGMDMNQVIGGVKAPTASYTQTVTVGDKAYSNKPGYAPGEVVGTLTTIVNKDAVAAKQPDVIGQVINGRDANKPLSSVTVSTQTTPGANPSAMQAAAAAIAQENAQAHINVAASSLPANTPVAVQDKDGKISTTTAGEIAKVDPTAQIAKPIKSFFDAPVKNGRSDHSRSASDSVGSRNGGNNAANSNSAHGLGGGNHIGGGSAQSGSRSVGKGW